MGITYTLKMSANTQRKPGNRSGKPNNHKRNYNRNNNGRRRSGPPPRRRKPAPKLTWWQKFLKAIGLYNPPKSKKPAAKKSTDASKKTATKKPVQAKKKAKSAPPQKVDSSRLYVGNLSYDVTESDLIDLFKGFGAVKSAEVVYNKRTQRSKGFAFVEMVSLDDAKRSVEVLHEQPFMGRNLIVNGARKQEEERSAIETPA